MEKTLVRWRGFSSQVPLVSTVPFLRSETIPTFVRMIELLPIKEKAEENPEFKDHPDCQETFLMCIQHYEKKGYQPPWICYYAKQNGQIVGSGAFKTAPVNNKVEIAYGVIPSQQNKGFGTLICSELVKLGRRSDPNVIISARTLPEENHSTRILKKNGFEFAGKVWDEEDGEVWEWIFRGTGVF